ncbi:abortive infection protein AbiGII [Streptococcus varani]|uniref:Abortive infection protein AbiGII n=1 Tax=Streptococcus varani TaxID=1608583 RepID=A0A0E4CSE5_9STRE|nr:abortive infection protein AbiGII [Streptococcus varani]
MSNIIGLESRTTSDMDFVIEYLPMDREVLSEALKEILIDDDIHFEIGKISEIKDEDPYGGIGFRLSATWKISGRLFHLILRLEIR